MRKLVVYYSLDGNTEFVAENIAMLLSADLVKLKPKKDLNPKSFSKFFWGGLQALFKKTPELLPLDKNPQDYDVVFIGTPVWGWTFVPAVRTFLNTAKLSNKKIVLFCTCGDPNNKVLDNMKEFLAGNKIVSEGKFVSSIDKKEFSEQVKEWIKQTALKIG